VVCGLGVWVEYREIVRSGRVAGDGERDGRACGRRCGGWEGVWGGV